MSKIPSRWAQLRPQTLRILSFATTLEPACIVASNKRNRKKAWSLATNCNSFSWQTNWHFIRAFSTPTIFDFSTCHAPLKTHSKSSLSNITFHTWLTIVWSYFPSLEFLLFQLKLVESAETWANPNFLK